VQFKGEFLEGFFGDQFVRKLENSKWQMNLPVYTLFTFGSFLPWLILLLSRLRRGGESHWPPVGTVRSMVLYAVEFAALAILVYAPGNITYERYMLPAAPLLAVALAGLLAPEISGAGEGRPLTRWLAGVFYVVTIPVVVLAIVLLVLARGQELPGLTNGCWLIVTGGATLWLIRYWRPSLTVVTLGVFLMLLTYAYENQFRPTYRSSPTPGIAEALKARGAQKALVVTWSKALDSQLRILTGGTLEVSECLVGEAIANAGNRFVIFPETYKEKFPAEEFELTRVAWRYESVNLRKLFAAFRQGEARKYLEEHREYFWLAERKGATAAR
jgi:4-amino-4-deoxy-L-arabinose transferase-like glycosyltransferase